MNDDLWKHCRQILETKISAQQYTLFILPLQAEVDSDTLTLYSPNPIVKDLVESRFSKLIHQIIDENFAHLIKEVKFLVGSKQKSQSAPPTLAKAIPELKLPESQSFPSSTSENSAFNQPAQQHNNRIVNRSVSPSDFRSNLNVNNNFDNFIEGKSNQIARASALQVSASPGVAYNPLFIYGGSALGKTHLMQAIGNKILQNNRGAKVLYLHSEKFVADMVKALQNNTINDFKRYYRSLDTLMIDDIQFFAGKDRTQEEFFHTYNTLLEGQKQIILTCDTYPTEVKRLEDRLKSRLTWGLTVSIEPPDLETRVAILNSKAALCSVLLPTDVAFFIAKHCRTHVRALEGALTRVIANATFRTQPISMEIAQEALRDQLSLQSKQITIDNILKVVADHFNLKISDILSQRRNRSIVRPRQIAMTLAKEITEHSLPEIGNSIGGRDHTTVMHAVKTIKALRAIDPSLSDDYDILLRKLSI
ncbi:MAG: chromosomal replication initiator protein DnaA [Gammaproteobacteria bacterium]|nr:chromosomal replication initiator protein DnaA [Gammaproteobacteria bacterium]